MLAVPLEGHVPSAKSVFTVNLVFSVPAETNNLRR